MDLLLLGQSRKAVERHDAALSSPLGLVRKRQIEPSKRTFSTSCLSTPASPFHGEPLPTIGRAKAWEAAPRRWNFVPDFPYYSANSFAMCEWIDPLICR